MIDSISPSAVAEILLDRGATKEAGSLLTRCPVCAGGAFFNEGDGRWACVGTCKAFGSTADLAARLGLTAPAAQTHTPVAPPAMNFPQIISAAELARKTFPEPRFAVPGVVPEGMSILVGPPKKGKSWLLLGLCVAIASGGVALGAIQVEQGPVLYLALEDNQRRLKERLSLVLDGAPAPAHLHLANEWDNVADGGAANLDAWLAANPSARLVCVDVLARLRRPGTSSQNLYAADYAAAAELKAVADARDVALVCVHHTRKAAADDPVDTISGTNGLAGAADTILVLQRDRGRADATLYVRGRDVPEAELALAFDPVSHTWKWLGDAAEYRMSEERAVIVTALREADQPLSPKQIAQVVGKRDESIRFLIRKMAYAGEVVGVAGKYTLPPPANSANSANAPNRGHTNSPVARQSPAPVRQLDHPSTPPTPQAIGAHAFGLTK